MHFVLNENYVTKIKIQVKMNFYFTVFLDHLLNCQKNCVFGVVNTTSDVGGHIQKN